MPNVEKRPPLAALIGIELQQANGMSLTELIQYLRSAEDGSSEADEAIATEIGWKKVQVEKQTKWRDGDGNVVRRPLRYTTNLNDALTLIRTVAPGKEFGFSWEPATGGAQIPPDPESMAATPALALCISAMVWHQKASEA